MRFRAHDRLRADAMAAGEPVIHRHARVHLLQLPIQPAALTPEHVQHRRGTKGPGTLDADQRRRAAEARKRATMQSAHRVDAVVLQKAHEQIHFAQQSVFPRFRQAAFPDQLPDFRLRRLKPGILVQEKQRERKRYQRGWMFCLYRYGRMLKDVQNNGPGRLIGDVRNLIACQGQGKKLLPCPACMIKPQGIQPVAGPPGNVAALPIDFFLPCGGQALELRMQKSGKNGMQRISAAFPVKAYKSMLGAQQPLR